MQRLSAADDYPDIGHRGVTVTTPFGLRIKFRRRRCDETSRSQHANVADVRIVLWSIGRCLGE